MAETKRQRSARITKAIASIPTDDKSKMYSYKELVANNKLVKVESEGKIDGPYVIKWCIKCKSYRCHFKAGKCVACKSKESGLGNPEVHARTIKSQKDAGTFNMMNPKVQANKSSNRCLKFHDEERYCKACKGVTLHRVWDASGKASCRKCDFGSNGLNKRFCAACNGETWHNGSKCTVCNPDAACLDLRGCYTAHCDVCGSEQPHVGNVCLTCHPECDTRIKDGSKVVLYRQILDDIVNFDLMNGNAACGIKKLASKAKLEPADQACICFEARVRGVPIIARERFYASKLDGVSVQAELNEHASPADLDSLEAWVGVPGVWAVISNGAFLDVCETQDVGAEMVRVARRVSFCRARTQEELAALPKTYNRAKVKAISEHPNLTFTVLHANIHDPTKRKLLEMHAAHRHRALHWSPDPLQKRLMLSTAQHQWTTEV